MSIFDYQPQRHPRLSLFFVIVGLACTVLVAGLAWRQLFLYGDYQRQEEIQNQRRIIQPGPRGKIYDREGRVLVDNRPRYSAVVYLNELRNEFREEYFRQVAQKRAAHEESGSTEPFRFDWEQTQWESRTIVLQRYLDQINEILGQDATLSERDLRRHFWHRLLMPYPLMNDLTPAEYARLIEQLPIGSRIGIYTDTARSYPYGKAAAHALGYVTPDNDMALNTELPGDDLRTFAYRGKTGRSGLERQFDEHLQGQPGGEIWLVDRFQFQYEKVTEVLPKPGSDLHTSLDIDLQLTAERTLDGKTGAVVAVDIASGEVLALASDPSYDLNDLSPFIPQTVYSDINERGAWLNRAAQGLYPPGSTFKIITAISGLRNGAITPEEQLQCGSYFRVGNRQFPEHSRNSFGLVDLARSLEKSSNVYYYQLGLNTGVDLISAEGKRFGLDEPTGIELPFAASRMVVPTKEWKRETQGYGWVPGDTANMSIGQGFILTTPLHMAAFTASLARNETRTRLTLLHDPNRTSPVDHGGEPIGLTDKEYAAILDGMERAVSLSGTGRFAMIDGLRIAGKTGTAQITHEGQRLTLAWFIGFAPIEDPQIAIAVMVEGTDPNDNFAGGRTAAPIARAVFETYFNKKKNKDLFAGPQVGR